MGHLNKGYYKLSLSEVDTKDLDFTTADFDELANLAYRKVDTIINSINRYQDVIKRNGLDKDSPYAINLKRKKLEKKKLEKIIWKLNTFRNKPDGLEKEKYYG